MPLDRPADVILDLDVDFSGGGGGEIDLQSFPREGDRLRHQLSPAIPGIHRDETVGPQRQPLDVRRRLPVPPLDVHRHLVVTGGHDAEHRVVVERAT